MLPLQPLHPLKHALQIFTDTSIEGWGTHLNELTARGTWCLPERQLNSGCLYKQRGGMKSGPLCALLWRILTWCTRRQVTLKARHIPGRLKRQAIQTRPDHSNGTVPSPRGVPNYMLPVAPATSGLVCHQVQQQSATVCLTGSRPPSRGSGHTQSVLGRSGPFAFPPAAILAKWWRSYRNTHATESFWLHRGGPTCPGSGIWWLCPVRSHCVFPVCPIW